MVGAAIFEWVEAIADTCPAPIAARLSQGALWSLFTFAGVLVGILGYLRWQEARAGTAPRGAAFAAARRGTD